MANTVIQFKRYQHPGGVRQRRTDLVVATEPNQVWRAMTRRGIETYKEAATLCGVSDTLLGRVNTCTPISQKYADWVNLGLSQKPELPIYAEMEKKPEAAVESTPSAEPKPQQLITVPTRVMDPNVEALVVLAREVLDTPEKIGQFVTELVRS